MTNQHLITPTENLIHKWESEWHHNRGQDTYEEFMAKQAAQWGADQRGAATEAKLQEARDKELVACCEWLAEHTCFHSESDLIKDLRAARRPQSPTLKEQALALVNHDFSDQPCLSEEGYAIIRRALEALPND